MSGGVAGRLHSVRAAIAAACARVGRDPAGVRLLAVSKTQPASAVRAAFAAGQRAFGENRVQELVRKAGELADLAGIEWHLIGSLQTNKVRDLLAVPGLVLVHSLDRPKLADALQAECERVRRRLDVLLQVNATGEAHKHGVEPAGVRGLLAHVRGCDHLVVRGLMAMGPGSGPAWPVFRAVADVWSQVSVENGVRMDVLSLGMSGDLAEAVAAGSTLVRLGTAVFGERAG